MDRRSFLSAIAATALIAAPSAARAQQSGKIWRLGHLTLSSGPDEMVEAFRAQLRALGYIEGGNLSIEYRWAAGNLERLPEMAAELVRLNVDVIVTRTAIVALAAKGATSTIPIVMANAADPVGMGGYNMDSHHTQRCATGSGKAGLWQGDSRRYAGRGDSDGFPSPEP